MEKNRERILKKGDLWIIILAFVLAGILFFLNTRQAEGERVLVTVKGTVTTYPLAEDKRIVLKQDEECYNTIVIENGEVSMENASCPDQICVHHKKISKNAEMIICLPNEVYIEVESDNKSEIDN